MSDQDVFIGLDGGGTKTLTLIVDKQGKELARHTSSCSNYNSVGKESAKAAVYEGINNVLEKSGCKKEQLKGICLGMSGVDRPDDIELVLGWMRELVPGAKYEISNDAVVALASGTKGVLYGVVVISGTGTISLGFNKQGERTRSAGYGPLLGDYGSGYQIGFDILRAVLRAKDEVGPKTSLTGAVLKQLNLTREDDLIAWAYDPKNQGWQRFAHLAPLATEHALQGDQMAKEVIEAAATALFEYISSVIYRLKLDKDENVPLVLAGGNIERECLLSDTLREKVMKKFPNISVRLPTTDFATGAALIALEKFK
ncbi:hypothetical protein CYY_000373 [Polysphondylium violaceum]|uniref:N-acetyl-D-glucosamine kinase n=1 Tax=Polysphondylium violaceum TaxID=133409 RepID=A0A8J4QAY9_9MYCE|nr:hypothetical protein CYY_000373 [Polysphondylium violaceum]